MKEVNKWLYILLAVLLGSFGIHKFYAGKPVVGLLFAVFFWTGVPHILAIIGAIITLLKPADEHGNVLV
ncbi:TM2 domain-containing protein [Staphylococcus pettenkoferi]|uniref:TM2 domain-containing protein n=1 Tax=Staphylococcus pettenkoferi TaxID=170573 RepID=UPI00119F5C24|nr:TM2 domain-containing protein [Staphylococcus pettenkoferi]